MSASHHRCCCDGCCTGGAYGYLRVRLISGEPKTPEAQYELLDPPAISGGVKFFFGEIESATVKPHEALIQLGFTDWVGTAVICEPEPTEPEGDIYLASSWRGSMAVNYSAEYRGRPALGASGATGGDVLPTPVSVDFDAQLVVTGQQISVAGATGFDPEIGDYDFTGYINFWVEILWNTATGFVTSRVFVRHATEERQSVDGIPPFVQSYCESGDLLGCLNIAVHSGDSIPWAFDFDGVAFPFTVRMEGVYGLGAPGLPLPPCPSPSLLLLPFREPVLDTNLEAASILVSGAPQLCGDERVFSGADCELGSDSPCVIGGIVRDPACCADPSDPSCTDDSTADCCDDPENPTPSNFVYLPSTRQRHRVFWLIEQYRSGSSGTLQDLWAGYFNLDRPAPGAQSDCRISRTSSVGPAMGTHAYHIFYPSGGGTPTLNNNSYVFGVDLGENAPLPSRAGFQLHIVGEASNTVALISCRAPLVFGDAPFLSVSGLFGVSNIPNTVRTPRLFHALPYNGSVPFYTGVNLYLQTIGNPDPSYRWRTHITVEAYASNYSPCPFPESPALMALLEDRPGSRDPAVLRAIKRQLRGCKGCGDPGAEDMA